MKTWIACGILIAAVLTTSEALTCHQCVGAEKVPSAIASTIATLPGVSSIAGAAGLSWCNGTSVTCSATMNFCVKHATKRSITIGSTVYSHSLYVENCATQTAVTPIGSSGLVNVASGQCYTLSTSSSNGVTTDTIDCYCNNKDLCNGTEIKAISFFVMIIGVIAALYV